MQKPSNLLIYYGYPSCFNSAVNGWNLEKVVQNLSKYSLIVFGSGLEDSSHSDHNNTRTVIDKLADLNPSILIFGYVSANQNYSQFKDKVNKWNDLLVSGIFIDEAGYDFNVNRVSFNTIVSLVHSRSDANIVFANSWNTNHIIGTSDDTNFPNSSFNPDGLASELKTSDWILVESFAVNTASYSGNDGYSDAPTWLLRGQRAIVAQRNLKINIASVAVINNDNPAGENLHDFAYYAAYMFEHDAFGSSDTNYGASSASVRTWSRPTGDIGDSSKVLMPAQEDPLTSGGYHRYGSTGRILLNFNSKTYNLLKWL